MISYGLYNQHNANIVENHIKYFLSRNPSFIYKTSPDGEIHIEGPIILSHSSKINVRISLPPEFPNLAPNCTVLKAKGLKVLKDSKLIDTTGKIYHPYLSTWGPQSDLSILVGCLKNDLARHPPLYASRDEIKNVLKTFLVDEAESICKPIQNKLNTLQSKKNRLESEKKQILKEVNELETSNKPMSEEIKEMEEDLKFSIPFKAKFSEEGVDSVLKCNEDVKGEGFIRYSSIDRAITDTVSALRKEMDKGKHSAALFRTSVSKLMKKQFGARQVIVASIAPVREKKKVEENEKTLRGGNVVEENEKTVKEIQYECL